MERRKRIKRVVRSLTIQLFQKHADIIEKISEMEDVSGRIRQLILDYGEDKFPVIPAYAEAMKMRADEKKKEADEKRKFDNLDPREYCEGTLSGKAGEFTCNLITFSGRVHKIDLADIKKVTAEDGYVVMNRQIKDGSYVMPSEERIDKESQGRLLNKLAESV